MPRKKEISEETVSEVSQENTKEEVRPERKRRVSKIVEEPVEEKKTYTVNTEILNVRFGPGYGYRVAKQILKGQIVEISNIKDEFGEIEPGLWVAMKFLE